MALRFRYKAVLSDIDGTLLGPGGVVSAQTSREVRRLHNAGIPFALVTGRMPSGVVSVMEELGFTVPMVCYSGALVVGALGRIVASATISATAARGILDIFGRYPALAPSYFTGLDWYVEDPSVPAVRHEASVVKASPERADFMDLLEGGKLPNKLYCNCIGSEELSEPLAEEIRRAFPDLTVIRSGRATMVEVMPPGVNKATGAAALLNYLGVSPLKALAFGDDANDVALLKLVGCGVAVGNAVEEARRAARVVAPSAHEDGVARFLQGCWSHTNDREVGTDATA